MDETMPSAPKKESVSQGRKTARRIVRSAPLFLIDVAVLAVAGLWLSGGLHPIDSIAAMDFFTQKKLEFPFPYWNGYSPVDAQTSFHSSETLVEIRDRIQTIPNIRDRYAVTVFDDKHLLIREKTKNPDKPIYLIMRKENPAGGFFSGYYFFSDMSIQVVSSSLESKAGLYSAFDLIFPYYLTDDPHFDANSTLSLGRAYATTFSSGDFYAFYDQLDKYKLEETELGFKILGYRDESGRAAGYPRFARPLTFLFEKTGVGGAFKLESDLP